MLRQWRMTPLAAAAVVGGIAVIGAQPQTLSVGDQMLPLQGRAQRSELFGTVDLYSVALYAPRGAATPMHLRQPSTPKALRIDVQYDGSLPAQIPREWRSELEPALDVDQTAALRRAYGSLGATDVITIAYTPQSGTTVTVSGRKVLSAAGQQLMAAFLDVWLGQTPVSEEVKEELLAGL